MSRKFAYHVPSVSRPNRILSPISSNRKTSLSRARLLRIARNLSGVTEKATGDTRIDSPGWRSRKASLFPLDPLFGNQIRHGASIRAGVNDGLVPRVLPA